MVDSFPFFISWLYKCLDRGIELKCNDGHIIRPGDKKSGRVISNNTSSKGRIWLLGTVAYAARSVLLKNRELLPS